jgi:hypothetical protein
MPQHQIRLRVRYSVLVCALVLPLSGWAIGQARLSERTPVFSVDDTNPTVTVQTSLAGGSAKGATLTVQLRGRAKNVHAQRETWFKVTATDENGVLIRNARLMVDFGDGRASTYDFDRRVTVSHTWREKSSYQIKLLLTESGGAVSRGKTRLRVGSPMSLFFEILGGDSPRFEEEERWRFVAFEREARAIAGALSVDWGDGTPETHVENFLREVSWPHTYVEEGEYTIRATIVVANSANSGESKSATFAVVVTDVGGPIDLREATIAGNSARDIADFKITSTVTNVTISRTSICIFHTKAGKWPVRDGAEGNPWVAAFVDGKLHAGTYEWLRPGQVCKGITQSNIGPHIKYGALANWIPKTGETVYFWVSTLARLGSRTIDEMAAPFAKVWP